MLKLTAAGLPRRTPGPKCDICPLGNALTMEQIAAALNGTPLSIRLNAGGTLMKMTAQEIAGVMTVSDRQIHRHRAQIRDLLRKPPQTVGVASGVQTKLRETIGDRCFNSIAHLMREVQPHWRIVVGGTCVGLSCSQLATLLHTSPRQVKRWRAAGRDFLESETRVQQYLSRLWAEQGYGRTVCIGTVVQS